MKKFKFKLEALMTLRRSERLKSLEAYGRAVQATASCQATYESIQEKLEGLQNRMSGLRAGNFMAEEVTQGWSSIKQGKAELRQAGEVLEGKREEEKLAREAFLESKRNEEILIKLKEKKHEDYLKEFAKMEELEIVDAFNSKQLRA